MNMHYRKSILLSLLSLAACATQSDMHAVAKDEFTFTQYRAPMFSGIENSKDDAKQTAIHYCQKENKTTHFLQTQSSFDTVEGPMIYAVTFKCAESDPSL